MQANSAGSFTVDRKLSGLAVKIPVIFMFAVSALSDTLEPRQSKEARILVLARVI